MSNQKIAKYLEYALKVVLYLILLSPLLVSSKYLFPFITTKTIYFRVLVEVAILFYVTLALMLPRYRPRMTKLSLAVVIFGIIIFLTALTGVNFYKSFWGTIERGEGFLTISHLIIYFLILTWVFKTKKEWINYLTGAVVVGFLVNGYALFQKLNVEKFLFWPIIHSGEGRLSATIGNAAFLAAFVLQTFFLSMFLLIENKKLAWKIFFGISSIFSLFILYHTQTRGALFAFLVGLFFLASLFLFDKLSVYLGQKVTNKIRIFFLIIIVLLITGGLFVYLNRDETWVKEQSTLNRLVNISKSDVTTQSRFFAWDTSFKGWKDRFLLGYGWENYNVAFNRYFHPEIFIDAGSQVWFDRAHNTIFDVAVATGLIGMVSYLIIFIIAIRTLWLERKYNYLPAVILLTGLICHFLQNIFVFDVLATYLMLFIMLGLVEYILRKRGASQESQNQQAVKNFDFITPAIILVVVIFIIYFFNLKILKANTYAVQGLLLASAGKETEAIEMFRAGINMKTSQTYELREKLADNVIFYNSTKEGLTNEQVLSNFKYAISELEKDIQKSPYEVRNYLYLQVLYNRAAAFNPNYYNQVVEWGEKALKLSPTRAHIYFEMGQARVSQKRFDEGIIYLKKATELNPENWNAIWNLMSAYIIAGRDEEAKQEIKQLEFLGFDFHNLDSLNRLYKVYLIAGRQDKMLEVLEEIVSLEPTGPNYAKLAAIYKQLGKLDKARQAVKKAVELDPSLAEQAEKFLETLKH